MDHNEDNSFAEPGGRKAMQRPAGAPDALRGRHAAHTQAAPTNPDRPRAVPAQPSRAQHGYRTAAGTGAGYGPEVVRVRKKRKKHRAAKRAAIVVAAVLVVCVGALAAFGAWYTGTLASNMALDSQTEQQLDDALAGSVSDVAQEPFYMLVIGSDNWETYGERSDALVLVRIDPISHTVTLVSVPRDTPYMLNGSKVKLNQAFAEGGPAAAVTAVQEVTGVDISYYAEIEFSGLADYVDSIGGIYVDVPYAFDYEVYTHDRPTVHVDAGEQLLDGEQCVALARMRTAYLTDQDAVRQSNIRAMVVALMNSVLHSTPAEIPGMVQRLSECVSTNLDMSQMISLATDFVSAGNTTIYTCTGPYQGEIDPETGLWLCYENPEGWARLMQAVDAGQDPSSAETQVEGK